MAELVTAYLDGALAWPVRMSATVHLRQCTACRHYFDQMRRTVRLLSEQPVAEPDPGAVDRLLAGGRRGGDDPAQT